MDIAASDLEGKSGIYCLHNIVSNKRYIGSSKNILHRLYTHRAYLRKGVHINKKLQNSWNKHTENAFRCYVVEFCPEDVLLEREQYYIDTLKPWFNIALDVQKHTISDEIKAKMSKSRIIGFKKGTVKLYQEKPIYQYSLSGKFIQKFKSIKEAAEQAGIPRSSINRFLEKKYKKGGNYLWSLTKEDSLPPYKKAKKDNSFLNKPIEVLDLLTNTVTKYDSITVFSKTIHKTTSAINHARICGYPYLKRYMIKRCCRSRK